MIKSLISVFIVISFVATSQASPIPPAPNLNVKAYVVMDFDSKMILASSNKDLTPPPASITKMMTAYVAFTELKEKNISLDEEILVSKKAGKQVVLKCLLKWGKE